MKTITPPKVDNLIDRQVRMWEVRTRLAEEGGELARRELVHLDEGPWLTVSRQIGSGGLEIARRVGDRLGWQTYDREILGTIARHHHLRDRVVERLDERAVGWISENVNHLFAPQSLPRAAFTKELSEVIVALGKQGRAVIVGRGGNWLLDPRFGLRVRVVAPLANRVAAWSREREVPHAEAEREVREHDDRRAEFIHRTFGTSIDDPLGYDLVLNTGGIEVEDAVDMVAAALRAKLAGD